MRVCWNWQTGTFEGRVLYDVRVQVPSLAPILQSRKWLKQAIFEIFLLCKNPPFFKLSLFLSLLILIFNVFLCPQKPYFIGFCGFWFYILSHQGAKCAPHGVYGNISKWLSPARMCLPPWQKECLTVLWKHNKIKTEDCRGQEKAG